MAIRVPTNELVGYDHPSLRNEILNLIRMSLTPPRGESLSATVEVFHQYLPLSAPPKGEARPLGYSVKSGSSGFAKNLLLSVSWATA
jgi:hypothetical protein